MAQLRDIVFCGWGNAPWIAPAVCPQPRTPGNCYSAFAYPVLFDSDELLAKPKKVVLDVGVIGSQVGEITLQLFINDLCDHTPAADPQDLPSFRVVREQTVAVRGDGPNHYFWSLTADQIATLCSLKSSTGIAVGFRVASADGVTRPGVEFARLVVLQ